MFLIIVDTNAWARGETLAEAFRNLFLHTQRPPTAGIIYEYEAENAEDAWVGELGWFRCRDGVEVVREKHFSPQEIFQAQRDLENKIDEVLYT